MIEDTEMLLVFVEDSLATADPTLEIDTANTGAEGVKRVQARSPDLVLLDYSLPDFNGDEVCRRLLADSQTARIPVIMMSGHVPEMTAAASHYENVVATIAKPFHSDALIEIVTRALADPAQFAVRPAAPPSVTAPPSLPTPKGPEVQQPEPIKNGNGRQRSLAPVAVTTAEPAATPPKPQAPAPESPASVAKPPEPPQPPPSAPAASAFLASKDLPPLRPTVPVPLQAPVAPATLQSAVIPPPPPIPVMAPPPRPVMQRTTSSVATVEPRAALTLAPSPALPRALAPAMRVAPARIVTTQTNTVVVGIALEVLAIQFSPTLQMAALRARPASRTISLHVEHGALPGMNLPEAGFELGPVVLDGRGQMQTIRLLPTAQRISTIPPRHAFPVGGVSVLPWNGGKALELTPTAAAPMLMQLSAPFELAGVELSPTFGIGALVLSARGGEIRVSLDRESSHGGAAFQAAQVLLNSSAQIAEILLDAVP